MGKYTPLENYLRNRTESEITLSFAKIEEIIDAKLPKSAYMYQAWWANENNPDRVQANAWMVTGFQVASVDFERKTVGFIKC